MPELAPRRHVPRAIAASLTLHFSVVGFLVFLGVEEHLPPPEEMIIHLADYDPLGGSPGGEDWGLPETESWAPPPEPEPQAEHEPDPEPEPEPPPSDFELAAVSDAGEELNLPPPPEEKPRPKPKPRPDPPPRPREETRLTQASAAAEPQGPPSPGPPAPSAGQHPGPGAGGSGGPGDARGGAGGGTGRGSARALDAYVSKVRNRMDRNKKYPSRGRDLNGQVDVNFTVRKDGSVTGAKIVSSSGHDLLDDEVLALVRRVAPFAPIPAELGRDTVNITVPVVFSGRR